MESGAVLDSQITASSAHAVNHAAHLARLHFKGGVGIAGGWAALYNDNNQWLQVDLQQTTRVTRIATQGRNDYAQWVEKYKLQFGEDGHTFTFYRRSGDHSDTVGLQAVLLNYETSFIGGGAGGQVVVPPPPPKKKIDNFEGKAPLHILVPKISQAQRKIGLSRYSFS